MKSLQF
jgi:chromosome segregation ATPase